MERAGDVRVVPVDMGWSDVGSMDSLHAAGPHDGDGNATRGTVITDDVAGSYIRADSGVVAAIGVRDLVIVKSGEAVLVAPLDRSQDVRTISDRVAGLRAPAGGTATPAVETIPEAAALADWLRGALAIWGPACWDDTRGGFHERFALDGTPKLDDPFKRLRVQARQIFSCVAAHEMGLSGPCLETARRGFAFLIADGWQEAGGWPHLFGPDGDILDSTRDTYDHAFVLFAMAALYRATGERDALHWAHRTVAYLDAVMADDAHGGYLESAPAALPRRANPHMHLLEAFLALFDATADFGWLTRARDMVRLFQNRFFDAGTGTVREYFEADWTPAPGTTGRVREPGHHWEWAFLLAEFGRRAGEDLDAEIDALTSFAMTHGHGDETGLVLDEVLDDGSAHKASHRLWPQTEALRGLAMLRARGRNDLDGRIATLAANIMKNHLAPAQKGMWIDAVGADGTPRVDAVPASTLYHLVTGIVALQR